MRRDPTAFRERFKKWKETGEYELPRFKGGKEGKRYIGGTTAQARDTYWSQDPELFSMVDSVANAYGINPDLLRNRLDHEGFVDARINEINKDYKKNTNLAMRGRQLFNADVTPSDATDQFGLDDGGTYLHTGFAKLINEDWGDGDFENEKGRRTLAASGYTYGHNIGITAAILKAMRQKAKEDFPNASDAELDRHAAAYYNRGVDGGKRYVKSGAKDIRYNIQKRQRPLKPISLNRPEPYKVTTDWDSLPKFTTGTENVNPEEGAYYFRPNGNQIKIDENTGELVDLVNGERGTLRLPEVTVTAAHPESYRSSYDPNTIRTFTDWLPVVGDIGTGIDIKNALQNQNYAEAGLLGGMMLLPGPLAKGAKKLFRPISKKASRFFGKIDWQDPLQVRVPEAENQTWAEITAAKYADKIAAKHLVPASDREKEIFKTAWEIATRNRPVRSVEELTHGFTFATPKDKSRFVNLINRNPEYYEFLRREGITDPLSQESVSRFLDNQFTSVRGVVANTAEEAQPMLTNTEFGRHMSGGDRLRTNGGVYTANSTTIADRFKNPQGSKIGTGFVAKLRYPHNISADIPIEDQLEQYRKMVLLADSKNPLFGTHHYLQQRQDPNVIALESDYVGRASAGDNSIQERAYLPDVSSDGPKKTLDIVDLQEYKNQSDAHGRWLAKPEEGSKVGLFIPRTLNNYSDFVRTARIVLKPKPNRDLYREVEGQALETFRNQWDKRNALLSKLENARNAVKRRAGIGVAVSSLAFPAGLTAYRLTQEDKFYDSPEYLQLLEDPDYEKALNSDDNSLRKLERKYRYKYKIRLRDEKAKQQNTENKDSE